jgi:hypothetical protein
MKKSKLYIKQFISFLVILHAIYIGLIVSNSLPLNGQNAILINSFSAFIFLIGVLIISPSLNKDLETFSIKFLLLTTVQMLLFMLGIVIILFNRIAEQKLTSFHFTGFFIICLAAQSYLLIKLKNNK